MFVCVYIYMDVTKQQCPLMTQIVVVCPKLTHKVYYSALTQNYVDTFSSQKEHIHLGQIGKQHL